MVWVNTTSALSASFQKIACLLGQLGSGPRLVGHVGSGCCLVGRIGSEVRVSASFQKMAASWVA